MSLDISHRSPSLAHRQSNEQPESRLEVQGHVTALDGIRGLAILLVMLHHLIKLPTSVEDALIAHDLLAAGAWGVDLFFVLSGFLITGILYDAKGFQHFFKNFYARRALRIFPLYYAYLVAYFLIVVKFRLVTFGGDRTAQASEDLPWAWPYAVNILIALRGNFITASLNHFWTLAVEEHFYIVWPLIIFLLPRKRLKVACLVLVGLAFLLRAVMLMLGGPSYAIQVLSPCRMDSFAIGGWFAISCREWEKTSLLRLVTWIWWLTFPSFLFVVFGATNLARGGYFVQSIGYTSTALLFGTMIVLCVSAPLNSLRSVLFGSSALRILGKYSYALYVFHHPINIAAERLVPTSNLSSILHSPWLGAACHSLAVAAISLAVAWASWYLYEKRFLYLKRFFTTGRA